MNSFRSNNVNLKYIHVLWLLKTNSAIHLKKNQKRINPEFFLMNNLTWDIFELPSFYGFLVQASYILEAHDLTVCLFSQDQMLSSSFTTN